MVPFVNMPLIDSLSAFLQASTSVSFYQLAPGLDVTLFGTLPDVASAAKVHSSPHPGLRLVSHKCLCGTECDVDQGATLCTLQPAASWCPCSMTCMCLHSPATGLKVVN